MNTRIIVFAVAMIAVCTVADANVDLSGEYWFGSLKANVSTNVPWGERGTVIVDGNEWTQVWDDQSGHHTFSSAFTTTVQSDGSININLSSGAYNVAWNGNVMIHADAVHDADNRLGIDIIMRKATNVHVSDVVGNYRFFGHWLGTDDRWDEVGWGTDQFNSNGTVVNTFVSSEGSSETGAATWTLDDVNGIGYSSFSDTPFLMGEGGIITVFRSAPNSHTNLCYELNIKKTSQTITPADMAGTYQVRFLETGPGGVPYTCGRGTTTMRADGTYSVDAYYSDGENDTHNGTYVVGPGSKIKFDGAFEGIISSNKNLIFAPEVTYKHNPRENTDWIGGLFFVREVNNTPDLQFGNISGKTNTKMAVNDANNVLVTFSLTGGGYAEIMRGGGVNFDQIILHNTTINSQLLITTKGTGTKTSVGDIIVGSDTDANGLKSIMAKTMDLRGDITIHGSIGQMQLRNIDSDHKITIGHSSNPMAGVLMKFGEVNDLSIDSNTPIKILMCTRWLDNDTNKDYIKAPSLGTLQVKGDSKNNIAGDFGCDLRLDGNSVTGATLTSVNIAGDVNNHSWDITGDVKTVDIKGDVNGWNFKVTQGNISSLKVGRMTESDELAVDVDGKINSLQAVSWHGGQILANMINSLNVSGKKALDSGDFDASITIWGSDDDVDAGKNMLNNVKIAGKVTNGLWTVFGNAGNIQIGSSPQGSDWRTEFYYLTDSDFYSDVKTLKVTGYTDVNGAKVSGELCVGWLSNSIKTLSVTGSVIGSDIELWQDNPGLLALGTMTVTKWIDGSSITSYGNVGTITTGGIKNSSCFAGNISEAYVDDGDGDNVLDLPNPSDANDLGTALINMFKVNGIKGDANDMMINSNIVARTFNTVLLSYPHYENVINNVHVPFGIAADSITKVTVKDGLPVALPPYTNLKEDDITPRDGDFVIRVK